MGRRIGEELVDEGIFRRPDGARVELARGQEGRRIVAAGLRRGDNQAPAGRERS
jgi:hypothetical protein